MSLTLESIVEQIPAVRAAMAEDIKRRRDAVADQRGDLIASIVDAERAVSAFDSRIKAAEDRLDEAMLQLEQARRAKDAVIGERAGLLAIVAGNRKTLHKEFGNDVVNCALMRVGSRIKQCTDAVGAIENSIEVIRADDAFYSPGAIAIKRERLADVRQELFELERANRDLQKLVLATGHPDEIRAAATRIVEGVFGADLDAEKDDRAHH
jgi:chromosome segregation ATPase